jgi:hypothetical protein
MPERVEKLPCRHCPNHIRVCLGFAQKLNHFSPFSEGYEALVSDGV